MRLQIIRVSYDPASRSGETMCFERIDPEPFDVRVNDFEDFGEERILVLVKSNVMRQRDDRRKGLCVL